MVKEEKIMILGISGSPRSNGVTASAVKKVLAESGEKTEYYSLSGKTINGCISCLGCTKDNLCVVNDDFPEIAEAMVRADAIVFGVPNYYNLPNGLSHCLLERCFCFRHQGSFLLKDKPAVIISAAYSGDDENSQVLKIVENFFISNKINIVSKFVVGAFSQCYTCDYGLTCTDGNVVKDNGLVEKILPCMLPARFEEQTEAIEKCKNASKILREHVSK